MAYDVETGGGPARPKWLIPVVIGGLVLLVGIVVAVVLVLRSRAGSGAPASPPSPSTGRATGTTTPSGTVSGTAAPSGGGQQGTAADQTPDAYGVTPAMRAASQRNVDEYLKNNPPTTPDYSNIQYNVVYSTSDPAMKNDLGFPDLPVVKYEYLPPAPGSTAPTLRVVNAPVPAQQPVVSSAQRTKTGTTTTK